jgi:hypothetical protein
MCMCVCVCRDFYSCTHHTHTHTHTHTQEYDHPFNFIFLWGLGIICFLVVGCYFLVNVYLTLRGKRECVCVYVCVYVVFMCVCMRVCVILNRSHQHRVREWVLPLHPESLRPGSHWQLALRVGDPPSGSLLAFFSPPAQRPAVIPTHPQSEGDLHQQRGRRGLQQWPRDPQVDLRLRFQWSASISPEHPSTRGVLLSGIYYPESRVKQKPRETRRGSGLVCIYRIVKKERKEGWPVVARGMRRKFCFSLFMHITRLLDRKWTYCNVEECVTPSGRNCAAAPGVRAASESAIPAYTVALSFLFFVFL